MKMSAGVLLIALAVCVLLAVVPADAAVSARLRAYRTADSRGALQPLQEIDPAPRAHAEAAQDETDRLFSAEDGSLFEDRALFGLSAVVTNTAELDAHLPIYPKPTAAELAATVVRKTSDFDKPVHNNGYFDPHNHNSGIMHWLGIAFATRQGQAVVDKECVKAGGIMTTALENAIAFASANKQTLFDGIDAWDTTPNVNRDLYCFSVMTTGVLQGYRISTWAQAGVPLQAISTAHNLAPHEALTGGQAAPETSLQKLRTAWTAKTVTKKHLDEAHRVFAALAAAMPAFKRELLKVLRTQLIKLNTDYLAFKGAKDDPNRAIAANLAHDKLKGARVLLNSQTMYPLIGCVLKEFATEPTTEDGWNKLSNLLENLLSASPRIDFDSSYVIRNILMETSPGIADNGDKLEVEGTLLHYRYVIQQLIDARITYIEMSSTPGGLPINPDSLDSGLKGRALYDAWKEKPTLYKQHYLSAALHDLWYHSMVTSRITVRWLVMGMGKLMAADKKPDTTTQATHYWRQTTTDGSTCVLQPDRAASVQAAEFMKGLTWFTSADKTIVKAKTLEDMLYMPHVFGLDFASPEIHCMGYHLGPDGRKADVSLSGGYQNLVKLADLVIRVGNERGSTLKLANPQHVPRVKRMQFHIHNGEGYPSFDKASIFPVLYNGLDHDHADFTTSGFNAVKKAILYEAPFGMGEARYTTFCADSVKPFHEAPFIARNTISRIAIANGGEPVHYARGRDNVRDLALMIRAYRAARGAGVDAKLRFRFGHATHADLQGAKLMTAEGIDADCNLSSNLATMALVWKNTPRVPLGSIDESLHAHVHAGAPKTAQELQNWRDNFAGIALQDHGIWNLLAAGTRTYLGSDGSGSEHSGHRQDYVMLRSIIRALTEISKPSAAPWLDDGLRARILRQTDRTPSADTAATLFAHRFPAAHPFVADTYLNARIDEFRNAAAVYTHWIASAPSDNTRLLLQSHSAITSNTEGMVEAEEVASLEAVPITHA